MSENRHLIAVDVIGLTGHSVGTMTLFLTNGKEPSATVLTESEAERLGEERFQVFEQAKYEYELSDTSWRATSPVCRPSANPSFAYTGQLHTGSKCGRLSIRIVDSAGSDVGRCALQVVSRKVEARTEFRDMLADVTNGCAELAMNAHAPVKVRVRVDSNSSVKARYQQFAFLRGLIGNPAFETALHRVVAFPHVRRLREEVMGSVRRPVRPSNGLAKYLARSSNRVPLSTGHPLHTRLSSLPLTIPSFRSDEDLDTDENRFVRFVLREWSGFAQSIADLEVGAGRSGEDLHREAATVSRWLIDQVAHPMFRDVSDLRFIPHGSPVLHKKGGYREIYEAWLKSELASLVTWEGVADFYEVGLRDTSILYEYWTFVRTLRGLFALPASKWKIKNIYRTDERGLHVHLKRGRALSIRGVVRRGSEDYAIRLDYNRLFRGGSAAGSWTESMQPDLTLTVSKRPLLKDDKEADAEVCRVHLDAKYRIDDGAVGRMAKPELSSTENEAPMEDSDEGRHERDDLIKMHAYRDAILASKAAFILFPGTRHVVWRYGTKAFPAVGAVALAPKRDLNYDAFLAQLVDDMCEEVRNSSGLSKRTLAS